MKTTKSEMRAVALNLLSSPTPITDKITLETMVAHEIARQRGLLSTQNGFHGENWNTFEELFWDLIIERVITPGLNEGLAGLPHFRLHSEGALAQARKGSGL